MVANERRAAILTSLTAIEADQAVRILYACESGSRGWGFASLDSDYDVRLCALYVHPLPWYLRVRPQRDVIDRLLVLKRAAGESAKAAPRLILNAFIDHELTRLDAVMPPPTRPIDEAALDRLLLETVMRTESSACTTDASNAE